jgi:hypothetical protein
VGKVRRPAAVKPGTPSGRRRFAGKPGRGRTCGPGDCWKELRTEHRVGRGPVLPLVNGVRRQGVNECPGVSPSRRPRLNSSRSTAGSASDRRLPAALPPGPPLTAQARQPATTIAVAAVDVAGQGFRACSILPDAAPQSHACGRRNCGVIRDSEPLLRCRGLRYRPPVTKCSAVARGRLPGGVGIKG